MLVEKAARMSKLKLYGDNVSPVCRAVMLLLASNNIPHDYVYVSLKAGEQLGQKWAGLSSC